MAARNLGISGILLLWGVFKMIRKLGCFVVLALAAAGCLNEPDCFRLNNNIVGISFKKIVDSSTDTFDITQFGTESPPLLFSGDTSLSRLFLPLNYFEDETNFYFTTEDTVRYLRLGYISRIQFVSEDCGEKFVLSELGIVEHNFDSVRLLRSAPTQDAGTLHIEIYQ